MEKVAVSAINSLEKITKHLKSFVMMRWIQYILRVTIGS